MAIFTSFLPTQSQPQDHNSHITGALAALSPMLWVQPPVLHNSLSPHALVDFTRVTPVQVAPRSFNSVYARTYFDDFYFHLYVNPTSIALGNLLSSQAKIVPLWNAYLTPVTISGIVVNGAQGIEIVAPEGFENTPFTLQPLQEITYQVNISSTGPTDINSSIAWESDADDPTIIITGARVVVFPFIPTWASGIVETISARSTVLRAPDGTEQSIALRRKYRRSFSYPYVVFAENAQFFDNLIFGWQSRFYGVPVWPEQARTTAPILAGESSLSFPTAGRTVVPGSLLMVFQGSDTTNYEVKEVDSVTSTGAALVSSFSRDWPTGSRIVPVLLGNANVDISGTRVTPQAQTVTISFSCDPATADPNTPTVAAAVTYRGYELFLGRTNWRESLATDMSSDVQVIDFNTGARVLRPTSDFSIMGRSHMWFMKDLSAVSDFRAWLLRRLGKTIGVWMPSGYDDFTLSANISSSSTSVVVKTNGYATLVAQHPARQDVYIRLYNKNYYARRIVSSRDVGNGTTILTLDSALGVDIAVEDIAQFSFLTFFRMTSDDTDITWQTPGIAESVTGLVPTKALQ